MRIVQLQAENVKRIKAVTITTDPNGSLVILSGRNEQGKSSAIDAIAYALGGERMLPTSPVRKGEKKAKIVLDLGDYIVTRTMVDTGGGTLRVTNREGLTYPSPQELLNGLLGKLSFDPLLFASMKPSDQAATLRALAQLDTTDLDRKKKAAYDERTLVNREVTNLTATLATAPSHSDVGVEDLDVNALTAEMDNATRLQKTADDADRAVSIAISRRDTARSRLDATVAKVAELEAALDRARQEQEQAEMAESMSEDVVVEKTLLAQDVAKTVPDRAEIMRRFSTAAEFNRKASENRKRASIEEGLAAKKAEAERLTGEINGCETAKAEQLAAAQFPVKGLGLSENGVTWNGLPFEQASTAVRTRVSVAIGIALNPRLKVLLVRGGNDLDDQSLAAIAKQAEDAGAQLWLERIAGGAGAPGTQTVLFEDGAVVADVTEYNEGVTK